MSAGREGPLDVKEASVQVARELIAEHGIEQLSLREVARRLGVSHQTPYRHYPSRDHLLAEVMRRCFVNFAEHLDLRLRSNEPVVELGAMGRLYLAYAQANPLEYRLMFGSPWPAAAEHPGLIDAARHAFDVLRQVLRRLHGSRSAAERRAADLDAMFIWSSMHGLATLTQSNCMQHIALAPRVEAMLDEHVLARVGAALGTPLPEAPTAIESRSG